MMDPRLVRPALVRVEESRCVSCGTMVDRDDSTTIDHAERTLGSCCTRPDGSMKSYEEVLECLSHTLYEDQGLDSETARQVAAVIMAAQPAWRMR